MRIGLRDLFRAQILVDKDGRETYGKPVRIAKAIQADLSPTSAEATLHADDSIDVIVKEFSGGTLTLTVNDLLPNEMAALLGHRLDEDGVIYASGADDPPYFAVAYRARKADNTYRYIWLYKVKFALPSENNATKGENINFQTPQIVGTFMKRADGLWKADYTGHPDSAVASAWFDVVREPAGLPGSSWPPNYDDAGEV